MSLFEIISLVILVSLVGAFLLRFAIEFGKFIYRIAPLFVPVFIIALLLYLTGNLEGVNKKKSYNNKIHVKNNIVRLIK